ncbi:MAG: hypothetical protein Q4E69_04105 [Bacilli bacterium]|nr:hypothetical protein [Bacilli bacterium]
MATGVSVEGVHTLQVSLLDSIESLKALKEKYENCSIDILANIEGEGKTSIANHLDKVKNQLAIAISNIDTYITDLNKIVDHAENQDLEIKRQIIRDVENIEALKGD